RQCRGPLVCREAVVLVDPHPRQLLPPPRELIAAPRQLFLGIKKVEPSFQPIFSRSGLVVGHRFLLLKTAERLPPNSFIWCLVPSPPSPLAPPASRPTSSRSAPSSVAPEPAAPARSG